MQSSKSCVILKWHNQIFGFFSSNLQCPFLSCASSGGALWAQSHSGDFVLWVHKGNPILLPLCNVIKLSFRSIKGFGICNLELCLNSHTLTSIFSHKSLMCKILISILDTYFHLDHLLQHSQLWTSGISHVLFLIPDPLHTSLPTSTVIFPHHLPHSSKALKNTLKRGNFKSKF